MSPGAWLWWLLVAAAVAWLLPRLGDLADRRDALDERRPPHDDERTRDTWWWGGHGRPGG